MKILNEKDIHLAIETTVKNRLFEKSDTEIETYELKLNEKKLKDSWIQSLFEQHKRNKLSILINSHDYYGLPKETIRVKGNLYHIIKHNNFRDVRIEIFITTKQVCHFKNLKDFLLYAGSKNITLSPLTRPKINILVVID